MIRLTVGLLLALLNGIRDTLPILAAALLHEAGHTLACILLRVPIRFFRIHAAGAVLGYDAAQLSYPSEAIIAAAGPLAGLLAAAASLPVTEDRGTLLFGISSLALSLFNLLPILPLDGGVILSALLHTRMDAYQCERIMEILRRTGTVFLWFFSVSLQMRCGGNLSLLVISVYLLVRLTE